MPLDAWVPLFTKMVWPVFAIGAVAVYHEDAGKLLTNVNDAIHSGRAVKVADWLEIGANTQIGQLVNASASDPGKNIDLSVSKVGGYEEFVFKGSAEFLNRLQQQLRQSKGKTIDVLVVAAGNTYITKLLRSYIAALGIRYVVFENGDRFVSWMDAGLFNSQLPLPKGQENQNEETWSYDYLREHLVGLHDQSVPTTMPALDVLKFMEREKIESVAVVEDGKFKSIVSREGIIAKLMIASVFKQESET